MDILESVKRYLATPSDYAMQLNGSWGSGKTYYYKNEIATAVKEICTPENAKKCFKPVYISLYGKKSILEIKWDMVTEFYTLSTFNGYFANSSDKKIFKISKSIGSILGSALFDTVGLKLSNYSMELKEAVFESLEAKEVLLCIDDYERKCEELSNDEILGFINSLTENGMKVVLITNQDKLESKNTKGGDQDHFNVIKEKVVSITVEYSPNNMDVFNSILKKDFLSSPAFAGFIKNNREICKVITNLSVCNFRSVKYGLHELNLLFAIIEKEIIEVDTDLTKHFKANWNMLAKQLFCMSMAYKEGLLSKDTSSEFKSSNQTLLLRNFHFETANEETILNSWRGFIEKFNIPRQSYIYINSLIDCIVKVDNFKIDKFIFDYNCHFFLPNLSTSEGVAALQRLHTFTAAELNDEEYFRLFDLMIGYARDGKYWLADYLRVLSIIEATISFNDLVFETAVSEIKIGICRRLQSGDICPDEISNFNLSPQFNYFGVEAIELSDWIRKTLQDVDSKLTLNNYTRVYSLFIEDIDAFWNELDTDKGQFYEPNFQFLTVMVPSEFIVSYLQLTPPKLFKTNSFLLRKQFDPFSGEREKVITFIVLLKESLNKDLNEANKRLYYLQTNALKELQNRFGC